MGRMGFYGVLDGYTSLLNASAYLEFLLPGTAVSDVVQYNACHCFSCLLLLKNLS